MLEPVELASTKKLLNIQREAYISLVEKYEEIESEITDSTNLANTSFLILKLQEINEDKQDVYQEIKKLQAKRDYLQADNEFQEYSQKTGITDWREGDSQYKELLIVRIRKLNEYKKLTTSEWNYNKYHLPVFQHQMALLGGV